MWGIRPEERTDFAGNLHRFVDAQTLQSLNIKDAVVKLPLGTLVPVNTLPLPKHLSTHIRDSPFPRAASREILNRSRNVGMKNQCELKRGKRNKPVLRRLTRLRVMMPFV
jgi:hypothetical protein